MHRPAQQTATEASSDGSKHFAPTGSLLQDGPGLWQRLGRIYGAAIRTELAEAYRNLFESGDCLESETRRTTGASFAPRPLRLLSLLIELGSQDGPPSVELAKEALQAGAALESTRPLIHGIRLLDDIRHLHMLDPRQADPAIRLAQYRSRLTELANAQIPPRLMTLLQSAITRYEKHQSSPPEPA